MVALVFPLPEARLVRVSDEELRTLAFLARRSCAATAWELAQELRTTEPVAHRVLLWLKGDGLIRRAADGWHLEIPAGLERLAKLRQMHEDPPR